MRRRHAGMTLVEMLVASMVALIIGAGVWVLMKTSYDAQAVVLEQNAANANARAAIDELIDRVRGAQLNGTAGPLTLAASNQIAFYDFWDQYGGSDHSLAVVTYWLDGDKLKRTVTPGTGTPTVTIVINGVRSLVLHYRTLTDGTWQTSLTNASDASAVTCTATVTDDASSRQITGSVQVRTKRSTS